MLLENSVSRNLTIGDFDSIDRAEAIRPEWHDLWERSPNATPFQTPEWQFAWWDAFGADKKLWLLSARDAETGRLVALLPAMILPNQGKVMLVGAAVSDELDILAEAQHAETAAAIFLKQIHDHSHRWSECHFAPLPECSPLRRGADVVDVMPVVDLSQPVPANMRRNLRRYRRRAEKIGEVKFESASETNFDELFDRLIDLHCARWNRRNQRGVLCEGATRRFHKRAARALLLRGITRVYVMRIAGRIVAGVYALFCRRQMRSYIGGFDPDLPDLSLGTLAIGYAIEEARREGATAYNFLRGAETYKRYWGARDHYVYSRRVIAR